MAKKYKQKYGVELDPETEVIATIGSKEGFSHLCLALLGPGDTVVVRRPGVPDSHLCRRHGRGECDPRAAGK